MLHQYQLWGTAWPGPCPWFSIPGEHSLHPIYAGHAPFPGSHLPWLPLSWGAGAGQCPGKGHAAVTALSLLCHHGGWPSPAVSPSLGAARLKWNGRRLRPAPACDSGGCQALVPWGALPSQPTGPSPLPLSQLLWPKTARGPLINPMTPQSSASHPKIVPRPSLSCFLQAGILPKPPFLPPETPFSQGWPWFGESPPRAWCWG